MSSNSVQFQWLFEEYLFIDLMVGLSLMKYVRFYRQFENPLRHLEKMIVFSPVNRNQMTTETSFIELRRMNNNDEQKCRD
jgi:hypothetical protein